jgi:UDP-glucuronate 4-epimerase
MRVLLTGAAGFIGYHVAERLLARGDTVAGVDNLNDYYDVRLKEARLRRLAGRERFSFLRADVADAAAVGAAFAAARPERVVHLAAQAGVRYSLTNPGAYTASNLVGFANVLEACRAGGVAHLVYASSSSVYGGNAEVPFAETHGVDHPVSFYAATKKANEVMAHAYSHLFGLPTTGLRYFTVYGPWGRPDMAYFSFAEAIAKGVVIDLYNEGAMARDFTHVADAAEATVRALDAAPAADPGHRAAGARPDPSRSAAPFRIYNIGSDRPVPLSRLVETLERCLGRRARTRLLPMQPGDVRATHADISAAARDLGYAPRIGLDEGIAEFVAWFREYRGE